jgi:hypothetical protein
MLQTFGEFNESKLDLIAQITKEHNYSKVDPPEISIEIASVNKQFANYYINGDKSILWSVQLTATGKVKKGSERNQHTSLAGQL